MRRFLISLFLITLLLAACQAKAAVPPTRIVIPSTPTAFSGIAATRSPTPSNNSAGAPPGCRIVSFLPTADPTTVSKYPPVTSKDWVKGPADASLTLIEYSDFMCPGCAGLAPVLALIQEKYPQDVRVVFRHFPLISIHDKAALAAQAAEAAGAQGKFWEMHDLLFQRQQDWVALTVDQFQEWVIARAGELGLEADKFKTDMLSAATQALVKNAWDQGVAMQLPGTPFLLINGDPKLESVPLTQANLSAVIALLLLEKRQFDTCPPLTIDPLKQYIATLHTDKGDIVIELFPDKAPLAVNNFIFLAQHGWYDGTTFHRVLPGFVAQAGDPTGTGIGGPGYYFVDEISPNLKFDKAGLVAMANSGPDTNGSQFFITYAPAPKLDGSYTIFGQVVSGMDVVKNLTPREPSLNAPPGDKITSITIAEK